MPTPETVVKKVVETARKWVRIRQKYRKLLDSKSATEKDLEKVKKSLVAATSKLETAVLEFEMVYRYVQKHGMPKKGKPFPWKEAILGGLSGGLPGAVKGIAHGYGGGKPKDLEPRTIDVQAEIIDR